MAEIKGFLLKRRGGKFGVHMKNAWQSRYFEIKGGIIFYYEDEGKKGKPRGKLDLKETSLFLYTSYEHAPPFSFSFEVVPSGKEEKWRLCASNKKEMDMWCESLRKYATDTTDLSTVQSSESFAGSSNEMTGFLLKRRGGKFGSHMKNAWQGRYFEIKNGSISYFEEGAATEKARGKLSLNGADTLLLKNTSYREQTAPNSFTFELVPLSIPGGGKAGQDEKWRLCAVSAEEMEEWCACIESCLGAGSAPTASGIEEHTESENTQQEEEEEEEEEDDDDDDDDDNQSTDVYGGDDVVMSLAWQRKSARTKSGVDRIACEAARAALQLEREQKGSDASRCDGVSGEHGNVANEGGGALEFDDLELDDEDGQDGGGSGNGETAKSIQVMTTALDEDLAVAIGGDDEFLYVHQNSAGSTADGTENCNERGLTPSKSLNLAKRWVSKRKTQLSDMITDINSNNQGRPEGDETSRPVFLDEEPLETEGTFCV